MFYNGIISLLDDKIDDYFKEIDTIYSKIQIINLLQLEERLKS
jgi:hypothetical protein